MADVITKTYLDLDGLKKYDAKIKTYLETRDGNLATLTTDAKDNLVKAINEVDSHVDTLNGAVTEDGSVLKSIKDNAKTAIYKDATEKDPEVTITDALDDIYNQLGEGGSVAEQIKTEIEKLDVEDKIIEHQFITKVSEENGKISVERAALVVDDIPNLTLEKITDAGTAAKANVATIDIASEGEVITALPTVAQVEKYVTDQIKDLEGAMHFVGVITRKDGETDIDAIKRVITEPKSGDVVVMADNAKEYIFVDPDPETVGDEIWREVGDEGLYVKKSTTIAGVDLQDNITKEELQTALDISCSVFYGTCTSSSDETIKTTICNDFVKKDGNIITIYFAQASNTNLDQGITMTIGEEEFLLIAKETSQSPIWFNRWDAKSTTTFVCKDNYLIALKPEIATTYNTGIVKLASSYDKTNSTDAITGSVLAAMQGDTTSTLKDVEEKIDAFKSIPDSDINDLFK